MSRRLRLVHNADAPLRRPRTHGDCEQVPRPCPFVSCRYNLYLDDIGFGRLVLNFDGAPGDMRADRSCALDIAVMTAREIADILGVSHRAIQQSERRALQKLRQSEYWRGLYDIEEGA